MGRVTRRAEGAEGGAAGPKGTGNPAGGRQERGAPRGISERRSQRRKTRKGERGDPVGGVAAERGGCRPGDP